MSGINRREFAESVAAAALLPLLGSGLAPLPAGWWEPRAAASGGPIAAADGLDAIADALAAAIRVQYGSRLEQADLAAVTRQIRSALERGEQMRKVEVANGDEPDFVFTAPPPAAS